MTEKEQNKENQRNIAYMRQPLLLQRLLYGQPRAVVPDRFVMEAVCWFPRHLLMRAKKPIRCMSKTSDLSQCTTRQTAMITH
jgi:hypothetical protein